MALILAVDNVHSMREMYYHALKHLGDFIAADDGDEALKWYERNVTPAQFPCDLIITDNQMNRMNGPEFLAALQQRHPQLPPRLLISGAPPDSLVMRNLYKVAQERGAVGVFRNPYGRREELRTLVTIAKELIENRGISPTLDQYFVEQGWKE